MKEASKILIAVIAILMFSLIATAAETSIKGTIYADWMMNLSKGAKNSNAFTVDRAYLGAESKLSDYTFARITFDIRPERFFTTTTRIVDSGGDTVTVPALSSYAGLPIILKYAYAEWKVKPISKYFKLRIGLQPTPYLNYTETYWTRRYVAKMIIDQNGWLSTSDFAAAAIGTIGPQGKLGEVELGIFNGTKYSDITENNNNKDINLAASINPFYNSPDFEQMALFGQFYAGTQNRAIVSPVSASDWKNQIVSAGGKLAYQKWVDLDFDLNFRSLGTGPGVTATKQRALSFWGNIFLSGIVPSNSLFKTLVLYGRVDKYDPNIKADNDANTLVVGGVECSPVKGAKGSIGYKQTSFQASGTDPQKYIFVNTEFKF